MLYYMLHKLHVAMGTVNLFRILYLLTIVGYIVRTITMGFGGFLLLFCNELGNNRTRCYIDANIGVNKTYTIRKLVYYLLQA